MRTNDRAAELVTVVSPDHQYDQYDHDDTPCCRCWLGQGLGAPGAAGGGGRHAARAQVRAVNHEKALVRTFFVIVKSLPMFR